MTAAVPSSTYKTTARRWYAAVLLMAIYVCANMDRYVAIIVAQPVKKEFGLSDSQVGLLTGFVFGLASAVGSLVIGPLIDRWNRRNLLAGSIVIWSIATSAAGFAVGFPALLASRMAVGGVEAAASPTSLSMLANIFPQHQRSTATSFFYLGGTIGMVMATAVGGFIAQHWGWRAAFLAAGAPGLFFALLLATTMREPPRREVPQSGSPSVGMLGTLRHVARSPVMAPHYLGLVLFAFAGGGRTSFQVVYFMRDHGLSVQEAGALMATFTVTLGLVGTLAGGVISDWLGRRRQNWPYWWLALVAISVGITDIAMVLASSLETAVAALAVASFSGAMWVGPGYGEAATQAPEAIRGKAIGLINVGANLAAGAGALFVGMLSDLYEGPNSLRLAMATVFCILFPTAALFALTARRIGSPPPPRRTTATENA